MTEQILPLQPFLHRKVILENLRDMFGLLSQYRGEPAENIKERTELGALFALHQAVLQATGQDAADRANETWELRRELGADEVDPTRAASILGDLKFKMESGGPMEWPTILTTGEVGSLPAMFDHRPWDAPRGQIGRFSVFADDARW